MTPADIDILHQGTGQDMMQDAGQEGAQLRLPRAMSGEMTRQNIQEALGVRKRNHFNTLYLQPALRAGLLEMTIPDKPRSKRQRCRLATGQDTGQDMRQDAGQDAGQEGAELRLLRMMSGGMTRQQMQEALGLKNRNHFNALYLQPALRGGLLEMTIPDKPRGKRQRYRLATGQGTGQGMMQDAGQEDAQPRLLRVMSSVKRAEDAQ